MSKIEKKIIPLSVFIILIILFLYFLNVFYNYSTTNEWALFGDYFGGILNPVLSFILILIVLNEARDAREQFIESKKLQLETQEQVKQQIELLKPRPDIIYYPFSKQSRVFLAIENIGNSTAFDVKFIFDFKSQRIEEVLSRAINSLENINYIPPKYKINKFVGHILINNQVKGLNPHSVNVQYCYFDGNNRVDEIQKYFIDENMLSNLHTEVDYTFVLKEIANNLKKRVKI